MGRPLVSPPFAARGLPNLRLMVFPDAREAAKGVRQRERKGLYATMAQFSKRCNHLRPLLRMFSIEA